MEIANFYEKVNDVKNYSIDVESDIIADMILEFMHLVLPYWINESLDNINSLSADLKPESIRELEERRTITIRPFQAVYDSSLVMFDNKDFIVREDYLEFFADKLRNIIRSELDYSYEWNRNSDNDIIITFSTSLNNLLRLYYSYDPRRYGEADINVYTDFEKMLKYLEQIYSEKLYGDLFYDEFIGKIMPLVINQGISQITPSNYERDIINSGVVSVFKNSKLPDVMEDDSVICWEKSIFVDDQFYSEFINLIKDYLSPECCFNGGRSYGVSFKYKEYLREMIKTYFMELQRLEHYRALEDDKEKVAVKK